MAVALSAVMIIFALRKSVSALEPDAFRSEIQPFVCFDGLVVDSNPIDRRHLNEHRADTREIAWSRRRAFVGPDLVPHGAELASFSATLCPPRAFTAIAIVGLAVALSIFAALIVFRDRTREAALHWREIQIDGCAMLRSPDWREGLYRGSFDAANATLLIPGTRADLRRNLTRAATGRWALAFAVVAVTMTPLAIACGEGFVF